MSRMVLTAMHWMLAAVVLAAAADAEERAAGAQTAGESLRTSFFEPTKVWQVHLAIPASEYEAMQPRGGFAGFGPAAKPKPAAKPEAPTREVHRNTFGVDLPWATGSITVDGQTFPSVGLRYKGNGTIADAARTIKKSFKVDLDRAGGMAQFRGMGTINLHSGAADPSKCRETLAYGLYRAAGVPAPRTTLAEVRLTVPGKYDAELLGPYTVVEQVDKTFLRAHFGTDEGLLMKPEGLRELEDWGDDWERYKRQYAPKREATKEEAARVIAFARLVHKADDATFNSQIASFLDIDGYLRFLAVTAFVANSDSFFALGHNYYLYLHPRTGRFHFFPWDLDRALANFPIFGTNSQQMDLSLTRPYAGKHRLTDRLLGIPEVSEKYQTLLKELAATCFDKDRLLKEVEAVERATKDLIARAAKAAEARKETTGGFGPPAMFGKPPALKTFVQKRTESVAAQLAGKSKGHIPSGGFGPGAFKLGYMMAGPMMEGLDAGGDGKLSTEEWMAAGRKLYQACAKDERGRVSERAITDGLNGFFPKPPEGAPRAFGPANFMAGPIVRRADADKDGFVTLEEMETAAGKLFAQFDKGKTGQLDDTALARLLSDLFPPPNFGPPGGKLGPPKDDRKADKQP